MIDGMTLHALPVISLRSQAKHAKSSRQAIKIQ